MNLTILGAGAWGTAVAIQAARRHSTCLWARDPAQAAALALTRRNQRYLPDVALPPALRIESDIAVAMAHADRPDGLLIIATPMAALAEMLMRLGTGPAGVVWLCKGFEPEAGRLGHELARDLAQATGRTRAVGVLSGPSFALEVARGQPTALVAASTDRALADRAVAALHGDSLRVYTSGDPIGVEVGGAVKNVLAIATGIADGMPATAPDRPAGLGLNARAALITRGLAEMTRLGVALGARADTFMGLSGLGDLVLTATGELSRNRRVGRRLAQGAGLAQILAELGHVAEGVASAPRVLERARAAGVEMPIAEAVVDVLEGRTPPAGALERLMGRDPRAEG